jgi:nucleotidyltransferase/DNA polymerase involved in DNA repair
VKLLPLPGETLRRLGFLGLRTLGQYAALPAAAAELQFGRAGRLAHRCARGEDDRPVISRQQAPRRAAGCELDAPLAERERLLAVLGRMVSPLLVDLQEGLRAPSQVRLTVDFDDGSIQERARTLLFPTTEEARVMRILEQLLEGMRWRTPAVTLTVALEQIQEVVVEQLSLFPSLRQGRRQHAGQGGGRDELESERERKLQEVQRYLEARFGANRLRRVVLAQPGAPLPEWRADWLD